jgi:hypothetical protein
VFAALSRVAATVGGTICRGLLEDFKMSGQFGRFS